MATVILTAGSDKKIGTDKADAIKSQAGDDTLTGLSGNDTLWGGIGTDSLEGGTDNDQLHGEEGNDVLLGAAGGDLLNGGTDNDTLNGESGNDTLDGGTGADSLIGGDGNDTFYVDNSRDQVIETTAATGGMDTVKASISYKLPEGIENLELTGLADLSATGNRFGNRITGNQGSNLLEGGEGLDTLLGGAGDDTLDGGAGFDTLSGGEGSDTYRVSSTEDTINEFANGGDQDKLETSVNYTLPRFFEVLTLIGNAIDGRGNADDNTLEGNAEDNTLTGMAGNDRLLGNSGNDTLEGGAGNDTLDGGDGSDDRVYYSGNQRDYKISLDKDSITWIVKDINGSRGDGVDEGTDRLMNIETIEFQDGVYQPVNTLPRLSVDNIRLNEGQSGSKEAIFLCTLSEPAREELTLDYATLDDTAQAGSDYVSSTGILRFRQGDTRQKITISILGDTLPEPDETFLLQLGNPSGLKLDVSEVAATIINDEVPGLSVEGLQVDEGNSDNRISLTVRLSQASSQPVTVDYASGVGGTAKVGDDYAEVKGRLTFPPNTTTRTIPIDIRGDTRIETDENFRVVLSNPSENAQIDSGAGSATVILINDDLPTLKIQSNKTGPLKAGETALLTFSFSEVPKSFSRDDISLSVGNLGSLTVDNSGKIYTAVYTPPALSKATDTLSIADGSYTNSAGDTGRGGTLSLPIDTLPGLFVSNMSIIEGSSGTSNISITVGLSLASTQTITANYATQDDTARAGLDYIATQGIITFTPGQTRKTFNLAVLGDKQAEANESLLVNLSSPVNATLPLSSGVITLTNDDAAPPVLSIVGTTLKEGNSGSGMATATVSLSTAYGQTVTVNYATRDGSAQAGSDYTPSQGILSFAPRETQKTISVRINADTSVESDETLHIQLSNPVNATLDSTASLATLTLGNDDLTAGSNTVAPVIDLGPQYGKLIYPVQVDGGQWFYYWDRSGDGTSANVKGEGYVNSGDYIDHGWLDKLFQQDINGRFEGENGAPVVGVDGHTDNTYRYATVNGVKLALPTAGGTTGMLSAGYMEGTRIGSYPASAGSVADNPEYDDYFAIWDAYNGTGTETGLSGIPPEWASAYYWSATPDPSGDAYVRLGAGYVYFETFNLGYVAVELL